MKLRKILLTSLSFALAFLLMSPADAQMPSAGDDAATATAFDYLKSISPNKRSIAKLEEFTRDFGGQAWGRDLQPGRFGMGLTSTETAGEWKLYLTERNEVVDHGHFTETMSWPLPEASKTQSALYRDLGIERYESKVVSGELVGATGTVLYVMAVTIDMTIRESDLGPIELAFSVLELYEDPTAALEAAEGYAESRVAASGQGDVSNLNESELSDPPSTSLESLSGNSAPVDCRVPCGASRSAARSACEADHAFCVLGASATVVLCGLACTQTGPAALLCLGACAALGVSLEHTCHSERDDCYFEATTKYLCCLVDPYCTYRCR